MATKKPAKPDEPRQWTIRCRLEHTAVVTVEAVDESEALSKFNACDWIDEREDELINWEPAGTPRPDA